MRDYRPESYDDDNLDQFDYDGHVWEVGYFGEKNNSHSAYGFRQDGIIIRVTSKYEAELIHSLFNCVTSGKFIPEVTQSREVKQ